MSAAAWIVLLVILLPAVGLLLWLIISASLVRIPSGRLGLLLERGRATEVVLPPGPHFVLALRRRMVEEYPANERAYRAGGSQDSESRTRDETGPALSICLGGDRASAVVAYSVRYRLILEELRLVHERIGFDGIGGVVRDESNTAVYDVMGDPLTTVDDLFGAPRRACQQAIAGTLTTRLRARGIDMTAFLLENVELGQTGEVIQATVRAHYELEREQAEARNRLARLRNDLQLDGELRQGGASSGQAGRYRDTDVLRDLAHSSQALQVAVHGAWPGRAGAAIEAEEPPR